MERKIYSCFTKSIESVKEKYHIDDFDDFILKSFGASLSDQYWVKPYGSELAGSEIHFFDNDFSEDLGEALLRNKFSEHVLDARTPDATSDGNTY